MASTNKTILSDSDILKIAKKIKDTPVNPDDKGIVIYSGFYNALWDADTGNFEEYKKEYEIEPIIKMDKVLSNDQIILLTEIFASNATFFTYLYGYPRVLFVPYTNPTNLKMKFADDYDKIILLGEDFFVSYNREWVFGSEVARFNIEIVYVNKKRDDLLLENLLIDVIGKYDYSKEKFEDKTQTMPKNNLSTEFTIGKSFVVNNLDELIYVMNIYACNRQTKKINDTLITTPAKFPEDIKGMVPIILRLALVYYTTPLKYESLEIIFNHQPITVSRVLQLKEELIKGKAIKSKISKSSIKRDALSELNQNYNSDELIEKFKEFIINEKYSDSDSDDSSLERDLDADTDYFSSNIENGTSEIESEND